MLVLFNKPFNVLCQFSADGDCPTLQQFLPIPGVYAAGRLDRDSEGLLLLTDDGKLQHRISDPRHKLPKTYWVQVEGTIDEAALAQLRQGVVLNDGLTKPAQAKAMPAPPVWSRDPPIRFRKNVPDSWLQLTIAEGRNRQVRRMTAAVGFPTLRLIRAQIGSWSLGELQPGQYHVINKV
jgi:23S rRNA pseudouridine2457 synthase